MLILKTHMAIHKQGIKKNVVNKKVNKLFNFNQIFSVYSLTCVNIKTELDV